MGKPRLLLLGLDCVPPWLVFETYAAAMPNLSRLRARGASGTLRSCMPPITVPAWACLLTGRDPGELGLYGFKQSAAATYATRLVRGDDVAAPTLWDTLAANGSKVAALFFPPNYPLRSRLYLQASCFLTPHADAQWLNSEPLRERLHTRFGAYRSDVSDFRSLDPRQLLPELYAMAAQHFAIAKAIWLDEQPDALGMMTIATDRLHHAFWHYIDASHPAHAATESNARIGRDFYAFIDQQLGELLALTDDDTTVMIVSDHGATPMRGGFCINQWLVEQGWLRLDTAGQIDWRRTLAWAEGGYVARLNINLAGRYPQGVVPDNQRDDMVTEICSALRDVHPPTEEHSCIETSRVETLLPRDIYREQRGTPPDALVVIGDFAYRALATFGHHGLWPSENDRGPDACNHHPDGMFVVAGPSVPSQTLPNQLDIVQIYDLALRLMSAKP